MVSLEIRRDAVKHVQAVVKKTAGKRPAPSLSRESSKREKKEQYMGSTGRMDQYLHAPLKGPQQTAINRKLLRFIVMEGISFRAVNSPWFLDPVGSLNVTYKPAGRHSIVTQLHLRGCAPMHSCLQAAL